ncbi:MAG: cytochrome c biogenesis protein CcsA [Deltaproteobacteria bacterium]|jgi:cytochrome c-type biogenesis protein CcmF|nr:cytochrome c biogenesis protein CcsA [Deltaproteobacteria bacterium]
MYIFAYLLLLASFLTAILLAGAAALQLWQKKCRLLPYVEQGHRIIVLCMSISSLLLISALAGNDFSLAYAARYSDRFLPGFYRLTALWAGQEGSMLFWGWSTAVCGALFACSKAYAPLKPATKLWFWMFFLAITAFFLLLLTTWNNPFIILDAPPADGNGLNPRLRHPGMIFHPPLLFLGYAAFTVPACLAPAQALSGHQAEEGLWSGLSRRFTLPAWVLLSAGIILGAWWAYMELDWNGYWGWDPVENASLLPWLTSTAFLHSSLAGARRGMFKRLNVLLIMLTCISAFAATYITRSGSIQSQHAYAGGGISTPLLIFILVFLLAAVLAVFGNQSKSEPLQGEDRQEGILFLAGVLLLLLAFIILAATCWPLLSKMWSELPEGLSPAFYNRVCLPVFITLALLLAFWPWRRKHTIFTAGIFFLLLPVCWYLMEGQYRHAGYIPQPRPLAWAAAAAASSGIAGIFLRHRAGLLRQGAHLGFFLIVLGIAFSGPYQRAGNYILPLGQSQKLGSHTVTFNGLYKGENADYFYYQALLEVNDGGTSGLLDVERRKYYKYPQAVSRAATLFTLGDQPYASLLGVDEKRGEIKIHLSVNPKITWIWIGGILLCLCPLVNLLRSGKNASRPEKQLRTPGDAGGT